MVFISSASFFFAFLSCLGVYVLGYAFTVDSRREPPFVEVVVYHRHASRATLAYLALKGKPQSILIYSFYKSIRGRCAR